MSTSRSLIRPFKQIDSASMGASIVGAETNVEFCDDAIMYIEWSGGSTPVGVLTVEFLKTPAGNVAEQVWAAIDFGTAINISGNTGSHTIQFSELPFNRIRPKYTRTSGTGTMTVTLIGKGV